MRTAMARRLAKLEGTITPKPAHDGETISDAEMDLIVEARESRHAAGMPPAVRPCPRWVMALLGKARERPAGPERDEWCRTEAARLKRERGATG